LFDFLSIFAPDYLSATIMNNFVLIFTMTLGINLIMFIPAYLFKTDKLTDISYSITFVVVAIFGLMQSSMNLAHILLFLMIFIWAFRLGTYLLLRIRKIGKDNRFDSMRESIVKFGSFWVLQGITVFVVLIPSTYFYNSNFEKFNLLSYLGLLIWILGMLIESIGDYQKTKFINNPINKGKWVNTGFWKYSRHPNYLGEILVWIGVYLFILPALNNGQALIGLISPVFITTLLLFVSGIPLLEKSANKKWGNVHDYALYKNNTGILLPKNTFPLLLSIGIPLLIGMIGGLVTATSVGNWFVEVSKPDWNPPGWIFGPVWTSLYVLMGIASYLIWKQRSKKPIKIALGFYGVQLLLNMLWSILFFGLKNPQLAFFEIIVLLIMIIFTKLAFLKIDKIAAILMIPYIGWVSFATLLNFTIWQLN
jgi:tryptophan-rich sensory protein